MANAPLPKSRETMDQDQFLTVLSREDALARFEAALFPRPVPSEVRTLADALGRALARDVVAPIDVPPFDRSNVDGFAVRSADLARAGEAAPVCVKLNDEVIACGTAPDPVRAAGNGDIHCDRRSAAARRRCRCHDRADPAVWRRRDRDPPRRSPGQFVSYAGSDIARGETLLRAGTLIGSREIGICAACGIAELAVARRPRVAVISTGDELVQPGRPLGPAESMTPTAPSSRRR